MTTPNQSQPRPPLPQANPTAHIQASPANPRPPVPQPNPTPTRINAPPKPAPNTPPMVQRGIK